MRLLLSTLAATGLVIGALALPAAASAAAAIAAAPAPAAAPAALAAAATAPTAEIDPQELPDGIDGENGATIESAPGTGTDGPPAQADVNLWSFVLYVLRLATATLAEPHPEIEVIR